MFFEGINGTCPGSLSQVGLKFKVPAVFMEVHSQLA